MKDIILGKKLGLRAFLVLALLALATVNASAVDFDGSAAVTSAYGTMTGVVNTWGPLAIGIAVIIAIVLFVRSMIHKK